ncbi:hypothetical protein FDG2_0797 [Candidatus Protofrankia californiensis]|uniref:HpcH/HpaI aldolase/citrate lyase domain-containing protein n=1 Tax=Candidatus Protofrankia californiensis TaxID=1839754 RepID=A0A1C3NUA4_9ACTN|nr:hypothetical protein FDG2_0797 [Candidatus Protofrankia californiensis]
MVDGKMQDDASVKQCRVVLELARTLAGRDPHLAEAYGLIDTGLTDTGFAGATGQAAR